MATLLDLPNETLEHVLQFLPLNSYANLMLVNKRFQNLLSTRGGAVATKNKHFRELVKFARANNATQLRRVMLAFGDQPLQIARSLPRTIIPGLVSHLATKEPQAAFVLAAVLGEEDLVADLLLNPGVRPTQWQDGIPLTWGAWMGYEGAVSALLDDGRITSLAQSRWYEQAMVWACVRGHDGIVELLLFHPKSRDLYAVDAGPNGSNYALNTAAQYGRKNVVHMLLQHPLTNAGEHDSEALMGACRNGHSEVVRLLLRQPGINPADRESAALVIAAAEGHIAVVHLLLQDGRADPWAQEGEAVRCAAKRGHTAIVELLLRRTQEDLGGMVRAIPVREHGHAGVMMAGCGGA